MGCIIEHVNGWVVVRDSDDVFDALRENHRIRVDAEVRELTLIAQACDEYTVDESRADEAAEKLIVGGAAGTACVGEFLALELAGLLEVSPVTAALRIRETLNLRDRHPELWAYTVAGGVAPWRALKVAARCAAADLSAEAARWVDRQMGESLARVPWARAVRCLEGLIVKADPTLAAERARLQRERRTVFVGDHVDGGSTVYARLDTADALALDETISDLANALAAGGDTEPVERRRATALGLLADPNAAADLLAGVGEGRPSNRAATLIVHIAADTVQAALTGEPGDCPAGVARVEGVGPLDSVTLQRFLGNSRVVVRPVVDLNTVPPVDSYEVPARLREHVIARNPVEVFPFSARPARNLDEDHTISFDHAHAEGAQQTRPGNLGPLSRTVHRAKTAGLFRVEQINPGEFLWTSRHGFRYLVTPDGTIALGRHTDHTPHLARTG